MAQNAETSCSKYENLCWNIMLKYRHYAINAEMFMYVLKGIHVPSRNVDTYCSSELYHHQLCCMSNHYSEICNDIVLP